MHEVIATYITELNQQYATGKAHEHSYRLALQNLMNALLPKGFTVVNEPTREDCGAPDFIILKGETPIAYLETKDLQDGDLDGKKKNKEQFDRYRASLDHIIFTDYLDFHLYENGENECVDAVRLADIRGEKIVLLEESADKFLQLINHLANATPQRIITSKQLAKVMAGKARLLANVIEQALKNDKEQTSELAILMNAFRENLIHDLNEKTFADIYAQTIAYGLFSARLNDTTPQDFSRDEANKLIPKSNPLLRRIFNDIAGYNIDSRIAWIVDDLVAAFRVTDMARVMKDFKQGTQQTDPLMHFYEDFLGEYDSKLKKSRGVYYTPQPVVDFIVRAVDDILKKDFGLPMGLADSSMINHEVINDQFMRGVRGSTKIMQKKMHRVQILDPATGTGTFLAAVIRQIYANMEGQRGAWNSYVEQHLLPRLNGFELMMASYTIAHLKLNMVLRETGYTPQSDQRLRVYLTNSLEEFNAETGTLFSLAISQEANEASRIKRDCPVMVMIGNPPYSGESQNKNTGNNLIEQFKREPGTTSNISDTKWLNSDELKFLGLAMSYINRNDRGGIIGYINPHTYLDGQTFRGMRWQLLNTFDNIIIVNLHGNTTSGETKNSDDENVFDIRQGVCINILVKTNKKKKGKLAEVNYCSLYGLSRNAKYDLLTTNRLKSIKFERLEPQAPHYFFVPKDLSGEDEYTKGFSVDRLFCNNGVGVCSKRDKIAFQDNEENLRNVLEDFKTLSENEIKDKYNVTSESRDQKVSFAIANLRRFGISKEYIKPILYRPFDKKWTYFTNMSKGFLAFPVYDLMKHLAKADNVGLVVSKQCQSDWRYIFVTDSLTDMNLIASASRLGGGYIFPLYLYSDDGTVKKPNFNEEIVQKIEESLGETINPQELFDYIYAVLHSPNYRTKYKEFLKIDFPRIPYPESKEEYHRLADLGGQLRRLHLMQDVPTPQHAKFDNDGSNTVDKLEYKDGCVWINKEQCFADVPELAWNFYIGGYQPAQKWLKDRKGRVLTYDDITHYRQIITILLETDRLMKEIDTPSNNPS